MPLQVYECEKCKFLIKHLMDRRFSPKYSYTCPGCQEVSTFIYLRENDPVQDWLGHQIRLNNKKRRKKDSVYSSSPSRTQVSE